MVKYKISENLQICSQKHHFIVSKHLFDNEYYDRQYFK